MKKRQALLSEEQWAVRVPLFPAPKWHRDGRGRSWASNRACLQVVLWVLRTGARWRDMPDEYPDGETCWRRLRMWEEQGIWLRAWRKLLAESCIDFDLHKRTLLTISPIACKSPHCYTLVPLSMLFMWTFLSYSSGGTTGAIGNIGWAKHCRAFGRCAPRTEREGLIASVRGRISDLLGIDAKHLTAILCGLGMLN